MTNDTTNDTQAPGIPGSTATYSPDDNKLRFYAPTRLSEADYATIREAGFAWAPKQGLFVAGMWTPDREDLLLKWAGEIEDEDKTLEERAEERAERFEGYEDSRRDEAEAARKAVDRIADGIPMGQPILVGHHSERHARRDAERIQNGMARAVKAWDTAEYWKHRAARAIHHARYKELPAVRARRIKGIEADRRKMEKQKAEAKYALRFWTGPVPITHTKTGEKQILEIIEANRETIARLLGNDCRLSGLKVAKTEFGNPPQVTQWDAWDCLRPDGDRYRNCPSVTVEHCRDVALRVYPRRVDRCDRWLAHYDRRLEYERAMLAAEGGTVADKTGPEKGGACRCWASPSGGWSLIQKVNKVSVTLLDNWGNGGADFTRTIPFDKLKAVLTRAQVEEARAAGRVKGETARGFYLLDADTAPPPAPAAPPPQDPDRAAFEALRAQAKAGVAVVVAPQLFPTPPELADRMACAASIEPGSVVLEPSAGTGNLIRAIRDLSAACVVHAVEINPQLAAQLRAAGMLQEEAGDSVICGDFLEMEPTSPAPDRVVMNPPFGGGVDRAHIRKAFAMLRPGGRLVALCAAGPRQREDLGALVEENGGTWEDLPAGSFSEQGTQVNVALLVIDKAPVLTRETVFPVSAPQPIPEPAAAPRAEAKAGQLALL